MEFSLNDVIQWVLLCATTLGSVYAGVTARAAVKQADAAKVQSAHAERQSKSAYSQADSAIKSNQIALLEKRLHIYQQLSELLSKMIQRPYSTMNENDDLWPFRSLVGLTEFYYSRELHSLFMENFRQLVNLYGDIDDWRFSKEENAPEETIRAKGRECVKTKAFIRKAIMANLDKMRDEIKAAV